MITYQQNLTYIDPEMVSNNSSDRHRRHHHTAAMLYTTHEGENLNSFHMFEKKLTPSDVGKLNRLVVPKQYAENYFPLVVTGSGTFLSFLDESGKPWKFRYSYWNSSQSYVFTKGWSRFVKEKNLEAGDVVFFRRQLLVDDGGRIQLYIGLRRQQINHVPNILIKNPADKPLPTEDRSHGRSFKILRLFGVDMECGIHQKDEELEKDQTQPPTPDRDSSASFSSRHI